MMTGLANIQIFFPPHPLLTFCFENWSFIQCEVYLQVITCSCSGLWIQLNLRNPSSWLWFGACCFLLFRKYCLGNNKWGIFKMYTEQEFGYRWRFRSTVSLDSCRNFSFSLIPPDPEFSLGLYSNNKECIGREFVSFNTISFYFLPLNSWTLSTDIKHFW